VNVVAPNPVQVYGNVGVAQPVSVYFATPQSITESNQPQPPFQVYGSAQGVQVYGNVGVAQPVSVYFNSPQPVNVVAPNPVQVYGNVGVFQPVSVYFNAPQPISQIYSIPNVVSSPNIIKNGNFATDSFSGWDSYGNGAAIDTSTSLLGTPVIAVKLPYHAFTPSFLTQNLPQYIATKFYMSFYAASQNGVAGNLIVIFNFTDGTSEVDNFNVPSGGGYAPQYFLTPSTIGKRLLLVTFQNSTTDTVWVTEIVAIIADDNSLGNINVNIAQPNPLNVYGTVGVAQPLSVYFNTPPIVQIPQPIAVYGNVGVAQPVSVYFNSPQPVNVVAPNPVQVYGNVGVAQPVSVYFATPQSITESNQPQPPYQVYGSGIGVQVYFATPQAVTGTFTSTVPQPLSVYAPSPLPVVAAKPGLQVYGNLGVFQPISVYFNTPQATTIPEPLSVYTDTGRSVAVTGNLGVFQPVSVYSAPNTPPVNVYDTQVITDTTQVFAGQIGAVSGANSQIVAASAGLSLEATLIDIWNIYGAAETVALRFGTAGQFRFIKKLNPNTGFAVNLINSTWRGPANTGLYIYTWEVMGGPLSPSGGFVTYTVMGQYLP
jgi:hypothetical protein